MSMTDQNRPSVVNSLNHPAKMLMTAMMLNLAASFIFYSCQREAASTQPQKTPQIESMPPVKSVLLYDTILTALADINAVITTIEPREAGHSLWKVQSDTIPDYKYLIQGHWPDPASYDSIHVHPAFRKALDDNIHVFTETRKWDLYRRYEQVK